MITRILAPQLTHYASLFQVVSVLGPRQSGKTTLVKEAFPQKPYVTLESLDNRTFAHQDPRGFLAKYGEGAIFDEVQNTPELFPYLQEEVDKNPQKGRFILTGSQNFLLSQNISQSLAGRTALLQLFPLSFLELQTAKIAPLSLWEQVYKGGYPKLYHENIAPHEWLPFYIQTYLEKDIRSIMNIGDLQMFHQFLRLLASHTAQELNYNTISNDIGISHTTVKRWVSLLEESFIIALLPPWFTNIKKRIVKSPKIHFLDTGLLCSLLQISSPQQLSLHPLKGFIFESWVVSEFYKSKANTLGQYSLYHYRENNGLEFDLLQDTGTEQIPYEIKSGQTVHESFFKNFRLGEKRKEVAFALRKGGIIYGGDSSQKRTIGNVFSWKEMP